jgi:hypothetical protein
MDDTSARTTGGSWLTLGARQTDLGLGIPNLVPGDGWVCVGVDEGFACSLDTRPLCEAFPAPRLMQVFTPVRMAVSSFQVPWLW